MPDLLLDALDLLSRYIHIVSATVLVGGTLFYEWVVPAAIDELKKEHQLDVFGRARWFFKTLVWTSAVLMVLSGIVTTRRHWPVYEGSERAAVMREMAGEEMVTVVRRPGWWWAAHASTGMLSVLIAIYLTTVRRPPEHPLSWMRLNLGILLIVMFLASATRHARQAAQTVPLDEPTRRVPFIIPRAAPDAPATEPADG